jgi:hypothetical protein
MPLAGQHDRPHSPDPSPEWSETWGFEFANEALAGFVRFTRVPSRGVCWCWISLRGSEVGLVVVRDDDVPLPRREDSLEVRGDGLWLELVCEAPFEHWGIGLEAFGLRVDSPADAVGDRLPVGLDLEWETDGTEPNQRSDTEYTQTGVLHGDVLIADERLPYEASCTRDHAWGIGKLPVWPT